MIGTQLKIIAGLNDETRKYGYEKALEAYQQAKLMLEISFEEYKEKRAEEDCRDGWIVCENRLPEEDKDVLIYTPYDGVDIAYISDENWRYTKGDEFIGTIEGANITAWQPLPKPYHEP